MRHLVLLALAAVPLAAQTPPAAPAAPVVFIKAGRLIDGRSDRVQSNVGILIEGTRIRAVGPIAQIEAQAGSASGS